MQSKAEQWIEQQNTWEIANHIGNFYNDNPVPEPVCQHLLSILALYPLTISLYDFSMNMYRFATLALQLLTKFVSIKALRLASPLYLPPLCSAHLAGVVLLVKTLLS